ncbi:MAG: ribonuclease HI family protein [Desulfobulbaceae bacterium]|jgi:ribonuclease HI|nr:ribonuclease HI family protein [Desulfobulbaceae bacterium]
MSSLFDAAKPRDEVLARLAEQLPAVVLEALFPEMDEARVRSLIWAGYGSGKKDNEVVAAAAPALKKGGHLSLYTDRASRGNPGEAGAGFVVYDSEDQEIAGEGVYLGKCTNNLAEYQALVHGIKLVAQFTPDHLDLYLDSQLIVRQVLGEYKVKNLQLKPLFQQVMSLLAPLPSWRIYHVRRELNKRADELANQGIDEK